jgi:hypothetical protein
MSEYTPMEIKAARILCERSADACGIDRDDNWNIYAEDFKADARAVLEGCAVPELLEALKNADKLISQLMPGIKHIALQDYAFLNNTLMANTAAIAKATGEAK